MGFPPPAPDPSDGGVTTPVLAPGTIFAERYQILRHLGTGGMGTVYLARHQAMERRCAIKVLHPSLGRDREARERFTREARNACRIAHPNVCTVYDFGTTPGGQPFLVLEYVEGRSLGVILAEAGALPLRRAVGLAEQIAGGLDAAHELGIVHRDLKPDNVMVAVGRGRETVKLVDFGIAKAIEPALRGDVTQAGVVVGTPEYMAPEQYAGDVVDHRSDVYSLGLVFCRMVAGAVPFRAPTARESLGRRLTERAEPLATLAPGRRFPPRLQLAVDSALSRDPRERFASAGAFAAALGAAIANLPEDESSDATTVRFDARTAALAAGRNRLRPLAWRVGALVTVGAAGIAAVALLAPDARDATDPAAPDQATLVVPPPAAAPESVVLGVAGAPESRPSGSTRPLDTRATPPIPPLPGPEQITDSRTRGASREIAKQIYARPDAGPARRAQAAFVVATAYAMDSLAADAVAWGDSALIMNGRAAAGAERDARRARYELFVAQWRAKLKEPSAS